ncbi:FAD-dependent monooxygenase [Rhodococcus sp. (in: high G+C Gram-positive bacteria)]|uniref:FAD-dependent monooxygenase n=1 Tax=Rhodococcus sp. TaxID=1831 RepID=UPI003890F44A
MDENARSSDVEVLVVGAGPTGLMMAVWLQKLGARVAVIDGKSGPTRESRALGVQARTMEIYHQLGMVNIVLDHAYRAERIAPGFESRSFSPVPLAQLGSGLSPFPGIFILEQSRTERILVDEFERLGGSVTWLTSLEALEDDARGRGCIATVSGPGDGDRITARFVVGADGGSSMVRKLRGIPFDGVTNEHTFYVADAHDVTGVEPGAVSVRFGTDAFLLAFPMASGGHYRLLGTVRLTDRTDAGNVTEDTARAKMHDVFAVDYGQATWFATYRVHHRVVPRFRDGSVFLAGDAGHVHSPVGAQGMNTGLQDAHNLALKLVDVLSGRASEPYLDRYDAERRPVARRLILTTDRIFGAVTSGTRPMRMLRRVGARFVVPTAVRVLPRLPVAPRLFGYVSQIRIRYRGGDDDGRADRRDTVVGRRLPWTGENFDVLRSADWQVHAYGPVTARALVRMTRLLPVDVHAFTSTGATALRPSHFYLVRPDGFVAAAADADDAVAAASLFRLRLREWGIDPDALGEPARGPGRHYRRGALPDGS